MQLFKNIDNSKNLWPTIPRSLDRSSQVHSSPSPTPEAFVLRSHFDSHSLVDRSGSLATGVGHTKVGQARKKQQKERRKFNEQFGTGLNVNQSPVKSTAVLYRETSTRPSSSKPLSEREDKMLLLIIYRTHTNNIYGSKTISWMIKYIFRLP